VPLSKDFVGKAISVLDEAIALGYNLVISHHPLIFKGYKSITGKDYVERCILKAIKNDIVIYSAHTNLDNAPEGVNFKIAEKIGLKNVRVLEAKENALLKLVTFVPVTRAEEVRTALASAGCGCIGNYDSCSNNLVHEVSHYVTDLIAQNVLVRNDDAMRFNL
jgi:putative NIF3 family GTP cyclohydrolase 1 type 2